jgi:2-polyprenyl-6-methoxyphenol hydroxylase-like FAD-dependent oxidoreductase
MTSAAPQIAIISASIGGPLAAAALCKIGAKVAVYEQPPALPVRVLASR